MPPLRITPFVRALGPSRRCGSRVIYAQRMYATAGGPAAEPSSTSSSNPRTDSGSTSSSANPALLGGVAGGGLVLLIGYGWYHFSGAKTAINGISSTKKYAEQLTNKVQQETPQPKEAVKWLRETAQAYAGFIPGAKGYVDKVFNDFDVIYEKHEDEVNSIVKDTYADLKKVTKDKGASIESVYEVWSVLEKSMERIGELASDAAEDLMENHPQLKEKLGGRVEELRSAGKKYGPQAKEEVQRTFKQLSQIFSQKSTSEAIQQAQEIIQEKTEQIKKQGDKLWQDGLDKAKPYLEKSPQVKQLVEENEDALRQGNLSHLWAQVRNAVESGDTQKLKQFVQYAKDQAQSGGS